MEQNFQQNSPRTSQPLRWPDNIEKEINKIKAKLLHFPVKEIARCLEHNNIIFKCAGIRALADRREHDYASFVLRLIDKKVNKLIRLESVMALGKMQNEEAIEPLKKLLYYEPFEIRTAAIMSLAKIGSSAVVPAFIQTLEDKDPRIRIVTAKAFTILGDKRNIIHLEGKNLDPDENVRMYAKKCVTMLRQGEAFARKESIMSQSQQPIQPPKITYVSGSASSPVRDSQLYETKQPVRQDLVAQDNIQDIPQELTRPQYKADGIVVDGIAPNSHISQLSSNVDLSNIKLDGPLLNTPVEPIQDSGPVYQSETSITEDANIYNTGMKDITADIKTKIEYVQPEISFPAKKQPEMESSTDYIIESKYYDTEYDEEIDESSIDKTDQEVIQEQDQLIEEHETPVLSEEIKEEELAGSVDEDALLSEDKSEVIESKYYDIDDDDDELDDLFEEEKIPEEASDIFESKYYDLIEEDEDLEEDLEEEVESFEPEEKLITEEIEPAVELLDDEKDLSEPLQPMEEVVTSVEPAIEVTQLEQEPIVSEIEVEEEVLIQEDLVEEAVVEEVLSPELPEETVEEYIPLAVEPLVEEQQEIITEAIVEKSKEDQYKESILQEDSTEPFEELVEPELTQEIKEKYEAYDLIIEEELEEITSKEVLPQFKVIEKVAKVDLDDAYHKAKESGEEKVKIEAFGMVPQIEPEAELEPVSDHLEKENEFVASDEEKQLIEMLLSKNLKDRKIAVKELNTAKTKEALEALAHAAATDISWVRKEAIKSMVSVPHDEKVTYLITFLSDSKWYIREEATKALGQIGSKRAIDSILNLLNDENKWVQETALRALAAIDIEGTLNHIEAQLNSENTNVKSAAKHLLHNHNKGI